MENADRKIDARWREERPKWMLPDDRDPGDILKEAILKHEDHIKSTTLSTKISINSIEEAPADVIWKEVDINGIVVRIGIRRVKESNNPRPTSRSED